MPRSWLVPRLALREQTRILQSVLDCMGDGVVVADSNARFLVFNPAAAADPGPRQRINCRPRSGRAITRSSCPIGTTPYPVEDLPLMRAIRGESVDQAELYIAYPSRDDGTWILVTGRPLRDEHGALEGGVVVFHDITRRKKAERRLAAQYETTRVLAEADSPGQASPKILETICESLDWDLGAFWRVDPHAQRLRCATLWRRPAIWPLAVRGHDAEICPGARGRAAGPRLGRRRCPTGSRTSPRDPNFLRQRPPRRTALHAAFAVPILLQGDCLGVLEFFSREARPIGPRHPGNDGQPGHPDRPVHRAASDARPRHPVGEAGLAGHALGRRGPRDQQPAGVRRQQPGRPRARRLASCSLCWPSTSKALTSLAAASPS